MPLCFLGISRSFRGSRLHPFARSHKKTTSAMPELLLLAPLSIHISTIGLVSAKVRTQACAILCMAEIRAHQKCKTLTQTAKETIRQHETSPTRKWPRCFVDVWQSCTAVRQQTPMVRKTATPGARNAGRARGQARCSL